MSPDWQVSFLDESRGVASEYNGGLERYSVLSQVDLVQQLEDAVPFDLDASVPTAPEMAHQDLPSIQGIMPEHDPTHHHHDPQNHPHSHQQQHSANLFDQPQDHDTQSHGMDDVGSHYSHNMSQQSAFDPEAHRPMTPSADPDELRELLTTQEETLYMQVFVEEVAVWMDSMDSMKHASRDSPLDPALVANPPPSSQE